uniref:L antigen family member 3 n=1 Tax=Acrobeloides nanus TaxID=290746 RepID=A0A914E3B2_9BILA
MTSENTIDWEPDDPSSDEDVLDLSHLPEATNSATIRLNLGDEKAAMIVYNSLRVDKEPKRSKAIRELTVNGQFLVANITCVDPKYLQKSIANLFEMCHLAKSTIDLVGAYQYKPPAEKNEQPAKKKNKK